MTPPLALNKRKAEKCKFSYLFSGSVQCSSFELDNLVDKNCPTYRHRATRFRSVSKVTLDNATLRQERAGNHGSP